MNLPTVTRLLAAAAAYDPRNSPTNPTERDAKLHAWTLALTHAGLTDNHYDTCRQAVIDHYCHSTDTLMPAHVINRIRPPTTPTPHTPTEPCETCGLGATHWRHTNNRDHPYVTRPPAPLRPRALTPPQWHTP